LDLNNRLINQKGCNVIFWQHDRLYDENEQPDIDAFSFTQFLEELLLESSRIYNYDGTEKEIS
jgi:hypothetical protein